MTELVPVRVRDCACRDSPHPDGDVVYRLPRLGLEGGIVATDVWVTAKQRELDGAITEAQASDEIRRGWLVTFVRYGAVGWNLLDEAGDPVPFDMDALLGDFELAVPVAEDCDAAGWGMAVVNPLVARLSRPSLPGPTDHLTSRTTRQTPSRRKRSSRATSGASRR